MEGTGSSSSAAGTSSTSQGSPASSSESSVGKTAVSSEATAKETAPGAPKAEAKPVEKKQESAPETEKKDKPVVDKAEKKEKEGTEEATEETEKKEKPPHKYHERLTKAFPDRKFEGPEDYDSATDEYLTNLEGYHEKGQIANKKLITLFGAEPQVGDIVRSMIQGATFREALARHISSEDITAVEGDPDYDGWKKNATEREERAKKRQESEKSYLDNLNVSQKEIEGWAEENGLKETDVDNMLGKIDEILDNFKNGRITKDALNRLMKAFNYEKDIATAKDEGEIAGKNQSIVAKKEAPEKSGDGLPRPNKNADSPETPKAAPSYFENLHARMKAREIL